MKRIILGIIFIFICLEALGFQLRFAEAEKAYSSLEYTRAIDIYRELYEEGLRSKELFYNLACAYYRNGDIGLARGYFIIAGLYDPSDTDIKHNLNIIEENISGIEAGAKSIFKTIFTNIAFSFNLRFWQILFFILSGIFFAGLSVYFLFFISRVLYFEISLLILFILLLVILPFFLASYNLYHNLSLGIIIMDNAQMRAGPHPDLSALRNLNEGIKIQILDERNDYYRIRLKDGNSGWIHRDEIFAITREFF